MQQPHRHLSRTPSSNSNPSSGKLRASSKRRRSSTSPHSPGLSLYASDEIAIDTIINVNLDNSLPKDYFTQDVLSVIKQLKIFKWRRIHKDDYKLIKLDRISGALTNCIYKVTYKDYYPLLLRLYGDVENIIDRDTELNTLMRLSQQNIGPRLLGCFNNGRFEEFLNNSITLNKDHIREGRISRMIARRMKELHEGINLTYEERLSGAKSWLLIDKWIKLIDDFIIDTSEEDQRNVFIVSWLEFKIIVNSYKRWLFNKYGGANKIKETLRFCHNDTQYGNLLFYDKSQRIPLDDDDDDITTLNLNSPEMSMTDLTSVTSGLSLKDPLSDINQPLPIITDVNFPYDTRLTVIDFEYAGANHPAFDITNHFSEWMYNYHDPIYSYRTDESKYPNKEERLNLLNSYVQYIPGSSTPSLGPMNKLQSTPSTVTKPRLKSTRSMVTIHPLDLPPKVIQLYNDTIFWRATCSIFWALWGIVSKGAIINKPFNSGLDSNNDTLKTEYGPNGEEYTISVRKDNDVNMMGDNSRESSLEPEDDSFFQSNSDDEFDHLKYSLGKIGVALGDWIQFGLINLNQIHPSHQGDIKYLDAELLH